MFTLSVQRPIRSKLFDIWPATSAQLFVNWNLNPVGKRTNQFFYQVFSVSIYYEQACSLLCVSVLQYLMSLEEGRVKKNRIQLFTNTFFKVIISENHKYEWFYFWIKIPVKSSGHACWMLILISPDKHHFWSECQSVGTCSYRGKFWNQILLMPNT